MNSLELEKKLHAFNTSKYPTPNNKIVVVLDENSLGTVSNVEIEDAVEGFDWNDGLTLLFPKQPVISKNMQRDIPQKAVRIHYDKVKLNTMPTLHCPVCEAKLRATDRYCSKCGQRVDTATVEEVHI